ncbi:FMN-binding protein [Subtercola frigoramans]|uniref:Uncharacterized protein with FMN-binding domain n=1 Tax=Subtercola frigoramans TaxID=120298 RepID=A0ABS2L353_9MICO|nr:FMN-binding protein [Subtercola frigoramans]MBM7470911.1 uncharacterized protein with FMN-binding domain [Subtercola frigoramans]
MRKRAVFGSIVSSAAVLAVGWQIGVHDTATTTLSDAAPASAGGTPKASAAPSTAASAAPKATATPTPAQTAGPATPATAAATPSAAAEAPAASAAPSPAAAAPAPAPAPTAVDQNFTGSLISTRYGTIQVQITVNSGKITEVTALKLTDDGGRSVQISARAAPVLRSEVLSAQSANVASVSGATYTSDGYLQSVQSALDQAGL